jgi:hypothetical protein
MHASPAISTEGSPPLPSDHFFAKLLKSTLVLLGLFFSKLIFRHQFGGGTPEKF